MRGRSLHRDPASPERCRVPARGRRYAMADLISSLAGVQFPGALRGAVAQLARAFRAVFLPRYGWKSMRVRCPPAPLGTLLHLPDAGSLRGPLKNPAAYHSAGFFARDRSSMDRALDYGLRGCRFESCRSHSAPSFPSSSVRQSSRPVAPDGGSQVRTLGRKLSTIRSSSDREAPPWKAASWTHRDPAALR